jgi:hypothetical protein
MKIQVAVAFVHRVLRRALLGHNVIVNDIVVRLLKNLPGLWNGLHQSPLRNPKQLTVDWVVGVHPKKAGIFFNFLVLRTAI